MPSAPTSQAFNLIVEKADYGKKRSITYGSVGASCFDDPVQPIVGHVRYLIAFRRVTGTKVSK